MNYQQTFFYSYNSSTASRGFSIMNTNCINDDKNYVIQFKRLQYLLRICLWYHSVGNSWFQFVALDCVILVWVLSQNFRMGNVKNETRQSKAEKENMHMQARKKPQTYPPEVTNLRQWSNFQTHQLWNTAYRCNAEGSRNSKWKTLQCPLETNNFTRWDSKGRNVSA